MISQSANETHKVRDQTLHQTKLGDWRNLPPFYPQIRMIGTAGEEMFNY